MPTKCLITGTVVSPDGSPIPLATVAFIPAKSKFVPIPPLSIAPEPAVTQADEDGLLSVEVYPGAYEVRVTHGRRTAYKTFNVTVPEAANAVLADIQDMPPPETLTSAQLAVLSAQAARDAALTAKAGTATDAATATTQAGVATGAASTATGAASTATTKASEAAASAAVALAAKNAVELGALGAAKNAAAYGFLPTNNADQNAAALQAAALGGGLVLIDLPGVYNLNQSILLDSNTVLIFGPNAYINKVLFNGKSPRYTFINRGAFTKDWNENISILGLKMVCNGIGNGSDSTSSISGLRGHVAFHYIRNLLIDGFSLLDGDAQSYVIHVCTFEGIKLKNLDIEGWKDAVHLGKGKGFLVRDCRFKTYDDPIALNAHDYASGQPELGWVEDGLIENCWDLADPVRGTTGYFARILSGAWVDWFAGMPVKQSDTVVASNGKMYRVFNASDGTIYTSNTEPSHASGTVTHDGINWRMIQETGVTHTAGVRNVRFRNIYLQKPRSTGLSVHFDNDNYSRSYYPGAEVPVQENIVLEAIHQQAAITYFVFCITPLKNLKILSSEIGATQIALTPLATSGMSYAATDILMMGNTFQGAGNIPLVATVSGRTAKLKILGSIKEQSSYAPTFGSGVTVLSSDL